MSESAITIPAAFIAGLLSFLSPCVLPLVPLYLSYISGATIEELTGQQSPKVNLRIGLKAIFFVLGFSAVFVALGATATSIGQLLMDKLDILMRIGGVVIVIFGLHTLGVFKIPALYSENRIHFKINNVGMLGAFLIGVTFAFGWTPCVGPVLGAILGLAASSHTVDKGVLLLSAYSLGLGIPFLAVGFATGAATKALAKFKKHFRKVEITSGLLILGIGVIIALGKMQVLTGALLKHFGG